MFLVCTFVFSGEFLYSYCCTLSAAAAGVPCKNEDPDSLYQNACMRCLSTGGSGAATLTVVWMCPPSSGELNAAWTVICCVFDGTHSSLYAYSNDRPVLLHSELHCEFVVSSYSTRTVLYCVLVLVSTVGPSVYICAHVLSIRHEKPQHHQWLPYC